jgi:hypothetical protein
MHVRIANRFRPFSHRPGSACLLPGTDVVVRVYPTRIELVGLKSFDLPHTGPVKNFTFLQDLEKGVVKIFGEAPEGYFCYQIRACEGKIQMGEEFVTAPVQPFVKAKERLSFGNSKKLDWDQTERRADPTEILPVWYTLSQVTPKKSIEDFGSDKLEDFMRFYQTGFDDILVPQASNKHLGISTREITDLIGSGGSAIRALFIENKGEEIHFLPNLPKRLLCGRMTGAIVNEHLTADFSWSKGFLRQVVLHANEKVQVKIKAQNGLNRCRMRCGTKDRGVSHIIGEGITFSGVILFDNFMH